MADASAVWTESALVTYVTEALNIDETETSLYSTISQFANATARLLNLPLIEEDADDKTHLVDKRFENLTPEEAWVEIYTNLRTHLNCYWRNKAKAQDQDFTPQQANLDLRWQQIIPQNLWSVVDPTQDYQSLNWRDPRRQHECTLPRWNAPSYPVYPYFAQAYSPSLPVWQQNAFPLNPTRPVWRVDNFPLAL